MSQYTVPKPKELERLSDEELVLEFAKWAKEHGLADGNGDLRRSTGAYGNLEAIDDELRSRGLAARSRLLPLLDHADTGIRYYAALWLLAIAPAIARSIIEEIATNLSGQLARDARGMLHALDRGGFRPN